MKKFSVILLLVVVASAAFAQQQETRQLAKFNGIRVGEAIDVYLKKGDKESARVEVDGVNLSDVETEVAGNTLRIQMRSGNYRNHRTVKVHVTYVDIGRISSSSAANVFNEEGSTLKTSTLDITCASAGTVELKVEAESISIDVASGGGIVLEGKAKRLTLEASSAGSVDAYNLECETVNATAASGGSAKVNVTKSLSADASSGGSIRYRGNPTTTNTDSSSGGSVKKSS
ncbi:MAG: head GIN domain-containing protein [Bacteroidota bacterium]